MLYSNESSTGAAYGPPRFITPLLGLIEANAVEADMTRTIRPEVIAAIKGNDVMRLTGSPEIAGLNGSLVLIANELRGIASVCASTAWCQWNHNGTFHHFAGLYGPKGVEFLSSVMRKRQWVCFPGGASTKVTGVPEGDDVVIEGSGAFASSARYADWCGVIFRDKTDGSFKFSLIDTKDDHTRIDATWDGFAVRASATDNIYYESVKVPASRVTGWSARFREVLRDDNYQVIHQRYREDWVPVATMWLGALACGIAEAALEDAISGIKGRVAIAGATMSEFPTVHVNLGLARTLISAGLDTVYAALRETDARIEAGINPTEDDYFRQCGAGMQAIRLCGESMELILRVLGGQGLSEKHAFQRRYRDFRATSTHIFGHIDRITLQYGRLAIGLETQNPF